MAGAEREQGPQRARQSRPVIPEGATGAELDKEVRAELSGLHSAVAHEVAQRLVLVGQLLDDDPETAYLHAAAARERAARVPSVREAVGLAAYRTERFAEALAELRTVRRLTGSNDHLPIMADCERGLGRPERALEMLRSDEARTLDIDGRTELLIVAAGARGDLGEHEAAVITLQVPELRSGLRAGWVARLRSAYSDALAAVGRDAEAREWLERAAEADEDGETGAAERLAELEGYVFMDDEDDEDDEEDEEEDAGDDGAEAPVTAEASSVAEEPVAVQAPAVEEPVVEERVVDERVVDEPVADEPVVDEPVAVQAPVMADRYAQFLAADLPDDEDDDEDDDDFEDEDDFEDDDLPDEDLPDGVTAVDGEPGRGDGPEAGRQ